MFFGGDVGECGDRDRVTQGVLRWAGEALLRDVCLGQGKKYFARSCILAEAEDEVIRKESANEGMERGGEAHMLN